LSKFPHNPTVSVVFVSVVVGVDDDEIRDRCWNEKWWNSSALDTVAIGTAALNAVIVDIDHC